MKRRVLIAFIILNIIVSVAMSLVVVNLWRAAQPTVTILAPPTIVVYVPVTATPNPNVTQPPTYPSPPPYPSPQTPAGEAASTPEPGEGTEPQETQIPTAPPGLSIHVVEPGESPATIADLYGIPVEDVLCQNNLEEGDFIYPGDVLYIPLEGCLRTTETPEDTNTPAPTDTYTPMPTVTIPPTTENPRVEITEVLYPGDITREEVVITNLGGLINLEGWMLYDTQGNTYTFPDFQLFPESSVRVATGVGEDTPILLHWGLSVPVWGEPGDQAILADPEGNPHSVYLIGE